MRQLLVRASVLGAVGGLLWCPPTPETVYDEAYGPHIHIYNSRMEDQENQEVPTTRVLESVDYCTVCTMPYELCAFAPKPARCKAQLEKVNPELYAQMYEDEGVDKLADGVAQVEIKDGQAVQDGNNNNNKKKQAAKDADPEVVLKLVERSKKKRIVEVTGLQLYQVDMKKAAKIFASRFACGASVVKSTVAAATGGVDDTIVVQGDFQDEIRDVIIKNWAMINENNIKLVVAKPKKSAQEIAAAAAALAAIPPPQPSERAQSDGPAATAIPAGPKGAKGGKPAKAGKPAKPAKKAPTKK